MTIPTLSLDDYFLAPHNERRRAFIQAWGGGLRDHGFVAITHHGIDQHLVSQVYECFKAFYALPDHIKRLYVFGEGGKRAYTPFGVEQAQGATTPDLKEFWHVGREVGPHDPLYADYGPNRWPDVNHYDGWPDVNYCDMLPLVITTIELAEMKARSLDLYARLDAVAMTLVRALAEFFGMPSWALDNAVKDGDSVLRVLRYPPIAGGIAPGAVRAKAHTDINLLTLLLGATEPGLELQRTDGTWEPVPVVPGAIIVDSGDMLNRLTNGVIPSTAHRVVNPEGAANVSRYSMPFFVHPRHDLLLEAITPCVNERNPKKWPAIRSVDFRDQRLREIGVLK